MVWWGEECKVCVCSSCYLICFFVSVPYHRLVVGISMKITVREVDFVTLCMSNRYPCRYYEVWRMMRPKIDVGHAKRKNDPPRNLAARNTIPNVVGKRMARTKTTAVAAISTIADHDLDP